MKKLVEFHNKHDLSEAAFQNVVFRVKNEMIPSGAGGDRRKKLIPDTIEELEKVADIGKQHVFFILPFPIISSVSVVTKAIISFSSLCRNCKGSTE